MLTDLLNLSVTIVRRSDTGGIDRYGNPMPTETFVETTGELQQIRRDEPADEGELSVTTWLLVLGADTDLRTGDAILANDGLYEVVGDPWQARNPRTQLASHVEATLKRVADDEGGS